MTTTKIKEELRQHLGELLSDKLYEMTRYNRDALHPDWCDAATIDEVIDAIAPALPKEDQLVLDPEAVPVPTTANMARMMLALGYQWLKEHAPQHLTESKAPAWETLPMADVPHPSKDGTRVVGFVVPNRGVEIPRQQLRELIGKPHPRDEQANWIAPVQGYTPGIPWSMHLEAYDVYRKEYGRQEALIDYRAGCRGGFGTSELDAWIPGWRERASEITALKAELVKTKEALHIALADAVMPARKVGGNYEAEGTIVSTFQTLAGKTRHVFEFSNPEGMLHIFGPEQVEIAGAVNGAPPPDCRDAMIESGLPAIPKSCPACGIAKHCARTGLEQKVPQ